MNNFRVGQKVVCIAGGQWKTTSSGDIPMEEGAIYEISGISDSGWLGRVWINLVGFPRNQVFDATNGFRPAVERGTDTGMAILNKILLLEHEEI